MTRLCQPAGHRLYILKYSCVISLRVYVGRSCLVEAAEHDCSSQHHTWRKKNSFCHCGWPYYTQKFKPVSSRRKSPQWELPFVLQNNKMPEQITNTPPPSSGLLKQHGCKRSQGNTFKLCLLYLMRESLLLKVNSLLPYVICPTQHELTGKRFMATTVTTYPTDGENQFLEPGIHLTEGLCFNFWKFGKLYISVHMN